MFANVLEKRLILNSEEAIRFEGDHCKLDQQEITWFPIWTLPLLITSTALKSFWIVYGV